MGRTLRIAGTWFTNIQATDLCYRSSKAGMNMATACMALELSERYPQSVVVTMDPGWCRTDMGLRGGLESPPTPPEDSVRGQIAVVEKLTPQDTGKYVAFDGATHPW